MTQYYLDFNTERVDWTNFFISISMLKQVYDSKFMFYPAVKANDKWLRSIQLILSLIHLVFSWEMKHMLLQFWNFSFWSNLYAYFQYYWFILPIHIRNRICHHAELQPLLMNLHFHLINFNFIISFRSSICDSSNIFLTSTFNILGNGI